MRKIAYTLHWSPIWGRGILKKVLSQARSWLEAGHDVRLFMLTPAADAAEHIREVDSLVPVSIRLYHGLAGRFAHYYPLVRMVLDWQPDLLYHRYAGYYPALAALAGSLPTVFEINTDDVNEYRIGPAYRYWYNRLTRRRLLSRARGMIFLTAEISRRPHFTCFHKPSTVISNGIALSRYSPLPPASNPHPRLIFIGSPGEPWHGIDKIFLLAERFPAWCFDVVGPHAAQIEHPTPANLTLHGPLDRSQYEPLFAQADVAIGTLALHRNKMQEASPLKVREYLAFGLPTIIAYNDTDFPDQHPFILQIANTPDNVLVEVERIAQFVEAVRGRRIPRSDIEHLDVAYKERQRLEFFHRVLAQGQQS